MATALVISADREVLNVTDYLNLGLKTMTAEDGKRGLVMTREEKPDVILVDREIYVDNIPLAKIIRMVSNESFIILVGEQQKMSDEEITRALIEFKIDTYLIKPINKEELLARIRSMFERLKRTQHAA